MEQIRVRDYKEMSQKTADILVSAIRQNPNIVLGLATGSTPAGTYAELIRRYDAGEVSFRGVRTMNLDEYVGLAPEHAQSFHYYMKEKLFSHIDISEENTYLPDSLAKDPSAESDRYMQILHTLGGIDIQLLGLGLNGHIGFNEPSDSFSKGLILTDLTAETIDANKRFFASADDVPRRAYSMGIEPIMHARRLILMVSGKAKSSILRASLTGPITPQVPASVLQLHPHVTVIADEEAWNG